jgi:hypothetical protein
MLFMPLVALGSRERNRARFGYANDISLLAASKSNYETLERDSSEIVEWARLKGLTFDAKKSELIHFTRRRGDDNQCGYSTPSNQPRRTSIYAGWNLFGQEAYI